MATTEGQLAGPVHTTKYVQGQVQGGSDTPPLDLQPPGGAELRLKRLQGGVELHTGICPQQNLTEGANHKRTSGILVR